MLGRVALPTLRRKSSGCLSGLRAAPRRTQVRLCDLGSGRLRRPMFAFAGHCRAAHPAPVQPRLEWLASLRARRSTGTARSASAESRSRLTSGSSYTGLRFIKRHQFRTSPDRPHASFDSILNPAVFHCVTGGQPRVFPRGEHVIEVRTLSCLHKSSVGLTPFDAHLWRRAHKAKGDDSGCRIRTNNNRTVRARVHDWAFEDPRRRTGARSSRHCVTRACAVPGVPGPPQAGQ